MSNMDGSPLTWTYEDEMNSRQIAKLEQKLAEVMKERQYYVDLFKDIENKIESVGEQGLLRAYLRERDSLLDWKVKAVGVIEKAADRLGRCNCSNDKDWDFARVFLEESR